MDSLILTEERKVNGETSLYEELLSQVSQGEVVTDPREGDHEGAQFRGAELVEAANRDGSYAAIFEYGNLVDSEGRDFIHKERVNLPMTDSHIVGKRIFLAMLHDFGIVPREHKKAILANSEAEARALVRAINTVKGISVRLRIKEDKTGFLRASLLRSKRG